MKTIFYPLLFSFTVLIASCSTTHNEGEKNHTTQHQHETVIESAKKKKPASPKKQAMAIIGTNHIHIDYSSPSVRGRIIWGGLVAYNKVWSTGAHKATSINFPQAVAINGIDIPAGKYGFFTIPEENIWTLILNKNWDMHLADDYIEADDIIRFEVTPKRQDAIQEALIYKVESTSDTTGIISVAWEYLQLSFEVTNN